MVEVIVVVAVEVEVAALLDWQPVVWQQPLEKHSSIETDPSPESEAVAAGIAALARIAAAHQDVLEARVSVPLSAEDLTKAKLLLVLVVEVTMKSKSPVAVDSADSMISTIPDLVVAEARRTITDMIPARTMTPTKK